MKTISKADFKRALENFKGSETRYKHKIVNGLEMLMTEGCYYVAEHGHAYWLFDVILSYQIVAKVKNEPFQVWKLEKIIEEAGDDYWKVVCEDGNDNKITGQKIEYSDFPIDSITIWFIEGVALLPSEY